MLGPGGQQVIPSKPHVIPAEAGIQRGGAKGPPLFPSMEDGWGESEPAYGPVRDPDVKTSRPPRACNGRLLSPVIALSAST